VTVRVALAAVLVAAGSLWFLSAAGVIDLPYRGSVGVLLIIIGLLIVLIPGRHGVLVVLGVVVVLAGIPALFVDSDVWTKGIGNEVETPASATDLEPFEQAIGKLTVDLTTPDLELDEKTVEASLGIGELVVLIPEDTDVTLDAHVGVGHAEAFDREDDGLDVDLETISSTSGSQELRLRVDVGIGNIRVEAAD
jgi:Cell wall-active antibiotics response LiaF, C-terminal